MSVTSPVTVANPADGPLHIVGRFGDPHSGAELQVLELARRLKGRREVQLWSDIPPHPVFVKQGVRHIRPFDRQAPFGGTLLLGSVFVDTGFWLQHAKPRRVVVHYNVTSHETLFARLAEVSQVTGVDPEITYVSDPVRLTVNLPGLVERSWIDLRQFLAVPVRRPEFRPFTVGRLSRDSPDKHHAQDPQLYRMLAQRGVKVRVQGGTCLAGELANIPDIELLPAGALPAADFLASIDLFFYRPGSAREAYGRVVVEAMASGLPVVAGAEGAGYAELVQPGVTGWMVRTQEEAFDRVMQLAASRTISETLGEAGRRLARELHQDSAGEALLQYYLN
ncbi:MAG: glycosyltransferase family 1 protein [Comamonadaceae bacterium]|nr:MAG: glycosyltransferase family 1 protein [Comamonadaceae bacterium]